MSDWPWDTILLWVLVFNAMLDHMRLTALEKRVLDK